MSLNWLSQEMLWAEEPPAGTQCPATTPGSAPVRALGVLESAKQAASQRREGCVFWKTH